MSIQFAPKSDAALPLRLVTPETLDATLAALPDAQAGWARANGFSGKAGEALTLPGADGALAGALIGWGAAPVRRQMRFPLAAAAASLPAGDWRLESPPEEVGAEALGWLLDQYRFSRYRDDPAPGRRLVCPEGVSAARLESLAAAAALTRDLINTPANEMGPEALEAAIRAEAARFGGAVSVVAGEDLRAQNFPLIHAVGAAAAQAPRLVRVDWGAAQTRPHVVVIGKGVAFDTGGLDIKPASNMKLMKKDMGGAANALGLARMIMAAGLKLRLTLLIPCVENSIAAAAMRPGDVIRARNGLSVEITNTDAEGRLILADALSLASELKPDLIVDFATLTGAARAALGPDLPALFSNDDLLAEALLKAGAGVRDPLWRMPLWPEYDADIASPVADLDNAPMSGMAGAVTAALFLQRFVASGISWAHLDIFGWSPRRRPGRPMGGEMQAARAVFALLERRHG